MLTTHIENDYNAIIGAATQFTATICEIQEVCDWGTIYQPPSLEGELEDECWEENICYSSTRTIVGHSDGFIPEFSQKGDLFTKKPDYVELANGVNHRELYMHETPKAIIENAFDNQYGQFFETIQR